MDGKDEILRKPKDMSQAEVPIFVDFLKGMLAVEPGDRKSAAQMLKHPWLSKRTSFGDLASPDDA